jgi:dephospho-CoA kinase
VPFNESMARVTVGVTGTFGSGKTTVCRLLKQCGAKKFISSDALVHEALRSSRKVQRRVRKLFDIKSSARLDRKQIAKLTFSNRMKRKKLEQILHPYVQKRIKDEIAQVRKGVVVVEVPLLFEAGFDKECDLTIAVTRSRKQILRQLARAGFKSREVKARQNAQFSQSRKKSCSDIWVNNKGTREELKQKVKLVWKKVNLRFRSLNKRS